MNRQFAAYGGYPRFAGTMRAPIQGSPKRAGASNWLEQAWLLWLAAGLFLLVLLEISSREGDCRTPAIAFRPGTEMPVTTRVTSGRACTLAAEVGSTPMHEIAIENPARHGFVEPRGRTGAVYRAALGYRGDDSFAIRLTGGRDGQTGSMVIRVQIRVK
jgi:hypothetical protein